MRDGMQRCLTFTSHPANASIAGPLFMLAAAFVFGILDGLIKLMGPSYRIWDIAFYRWGLGLVLLVIIFGRGSRLLKTHNLKLMIIRSISGCMAFLSLTAAIRNILLSKAKQTPHITGKIVRTSSMDPDSSSGRSCL